MEGKIISIREMRERRDPEYFINNVLNTPERLARVQARRDAYWEEVRQKQAEMEVRSLTGAGAEKATSH